RRRLLSMVRVGVAERACAGGWKGKAEDAGNGPAGAGGTRPAGHGWCGAASGGGANTTRTGVVPSSIPRTALRNVSRDDTAARTSRRTEGDSVDVPEPTGRVPGSRGAGAPC